MQQQQHQLWIRPMKVLPYPPSLQEERHQLQLHPPVSGDNGTLRLRDSKSRPGSATPTMRVSLSVLLRHIMYSSKKTKKKNNLLPARSAHWARANFSLDRLPVCRKDAAPLCPSYCFKLHLASKDTALYELIKIPTKYNPFQWCNLQPYVYFWTNFKFVGGFL